MIKLYFFLILFLFGCSTKYFKKELIICPPNQDEITQDLFPINTEREWIYKIYYTEDYLNELDSEEKEQLEKSYKISLAPKSTIFLSENGKLKEFDAWSLIFNGINWNMRFLVKCNNEISLVEVNNPDDREITSSFPFFKVKDTTYWNGLSRFSHVWQNDKTFNTNLGRINTIKIEENYFYEGVIAPNRKSLNKKYIYYKKSINYFLPGEGLFRKEFFDDYGNMLYYMMLEPYYIDSLSSPIKP